MKRNILCGLVMFAAASLLAADTSAKDEVTGAANKLAKENYSWTSASEFGNFNSSTDGKTDKEGMVWLSMSFGDNTSEAYVKGGKGAVKAADQDWQSLSDMAANSEAGPRRFMVRRLQTFKAPAAEAVELADKAKELKKDGDVYSSDLTEAGAKELLAMGRRGGNAPEPKNAKGSVKFWTKDGMLNKFELKLQGTVNFNGEDRDVDRTTTVTIKDVGTTKLEVPEAAKKKLS